MGEDFQHDNPENWKWGMFYFNKNDSRLVVRKLHQTLGWTFNFAHPISYVVLILIILIPVLYTIFIKYV